MKKFSEAGRYCTKPRSLEVLRTKFIEINEKGTTFVEKKLHKRNDDQMM